MDVEVEEDCVEWKYFEKFEEEIGKDKEPYRTEWMVWDDELVCRFNRYDISQS